MWVRGDASETSRSTPIRSVGARKPTAPKPHFVRDELMCVLCRRTVILNELFVRCYRRPVFEHGGNLESGNPSCQWQQQLDAASITPRLNVSVWRRSCLYADSQQVDKDNGCPVRTGRVWGGRNAPTAGGALVREQKISPTESGSEHLSGRSW